MIELCDEYKKVFQEALRQADSRRTRSSSSSWRSRPCSRAGCSDKAVKYRQVENITGLLGTAVNVQSMVFGNMGDDSGTGVAFTRDPATGENKFYGEFLINAQGEDVVAGIRTPLPVDECRSGTSQGLQAAAGDQGQRSRSTTATCRTSSSRSRTARCTCCRPATASGPAPRR